MVGQLIRILIPVIVSFMTEMALGDKNWIVHNSRVASFSCQYPQPRSLRFDEMVEERISIRPNDGPHQANAFNRMLETISDMCPKELLHNFSVYPTETVLHRCEQAGSCGARKGCLPTKMDEVKLIFAVTSYDADPLVRYIEVVIHNHTACACQNRKDKPKK